MFLFPLGFGRYSWSASWTVVLDLGLWVSCGLGQTLEHVGPFLVLLFCLGFPLGLGRWSRSRAGCVRAWLWEVWVRCGLLGSWSVVVRASRADPCLLSVAGAV